MHKSNDAYVNLSYKTEPLKLFAHSVNILFPKWPWTVVAIDGEGYEIMCHMDSECCTIIHHIDM